MKRFALVFALVSSIAGSAFAQEKTPSSAPTKAKKETAERQVIDMGDGENIDGVLVGADGKLIVATRPKTFGSLIKLRENFNREMVKSVDEL